MSRDESDSFADKFLGFFYALGMVAILGMTFTVSRCAKVDSIKDDCDHYGKFHGGNVPSEWYECKKQTAAGETR